MNEIEHLEGAEGIKRLFERTLKNKEKVLRTVLSDKPLVYLAGEDFTNEYMNKRRDSSIFLKSLRLFSKDVGKPEHKDYSKYKKEVKIAPENLKFDDSLVIWDDYVAIVNSENKICVLINNPENAAVMKKWFDFVWRASD
jgi:hypothetical protein